MDLIVHSAGQAKHPSEKPQKSEVGTDLELLVFAGGA